MSRSSTTDDSSTDGGRDLLHQWQQLIPHQLRELEKDLAGRIAAPFDAIFDLLEESGATLHSQAEALESAGRALQEAAILMKSQAELFERTVGTLRKPGDLAKSAAGLRAPSARPDAGVTGMIGSRPVPPVEMGQNALPRMRALVVYESVYRNTRAIAEGLEPLGAVEAKSIYETADSDPDQVDLLVVGGPTHMHGLTSSLSRRLAIQAGEEDGVEIERGARDQRGLRQWLAERSGGGRKAASFDTRLDRSRTLTGVAARGIARRLHGCGYELLTKPESFLVEDAEGPLAAGELERARGWGAKLAAAAQA